MIPKIFEFIRQRGWTDAEFARASGISYPSVNGWRRGTGTRNPPYRIVVKASLALGITYEEVVRLLADRSYDEQVRTDRASRNESIRAMLADGIAPMEVAKTVGCSVTTVHRVRKG